MCSSLRRICEYWQLKQSTSILIPKFLLIILTVGIGFVISLWMPSCIKYKSSYFKCSILFHPCVNAGFSDFERLLQFQCPLSFAVIVKIYILFYNKTTTKKVLTRPSVGFSKKFYTFTVLDVYVFF